jgi:membrane-associated protease RseP (regulator of RpoE activity)
VTNTELRPEAGAHDAFLPPEERRGAYLRLLLVIAGVVLVSAVAGVGSTVLVVAAILFIIAFHEFGHLVAAKSCGIKVTEYFVGFGPRLWSVRRGETEYGVKLLPLGGYCRIIGMNSIEEVDAVDEPRTYRRHPVWQRCVVALGGPATHFVVAFLLLFAMFFFTGDRGNIITNVPASNPIVEIDGFTNGQSPAQAAGFRLGDRIEAVNGRHYATFSEVSKVLRANPGRPVAIEVERAGALLTLHPVLADLSKVKVAGPDAPPPTTTPTGFLGIAVDPVVHLGFLSSIGHSVTGIGSVSANTVHSIIYKFSPTGISNTVDQVASKKTADNPNAQRFVSPVGIVRIAHQATEIGLGEVLYLLAAISIFVGLFNLLPLPPLDGSHVAVALYEKARSRRGQVHHLDARKLMPLLYAGLVVILALGLSALFLDLRDLLT